MRARHFAQTGGVLLLLALVPVRPTADRAQWSKLRPCTPYAGALLELGHRRSASFRALIDRLERSSVIVYVRFARCQGGAAACLHFMGAEDDERYVRVTLDRFGQSEPALCVLLAHELQHAAELADAPDVRDHADFERFLTRIGRQWGAGFETDRAARVAHAVQRELTTAPGAREAARR